VVKNPTPEELSRAILVLQSVNAGQNFNCVSDDSAVFERYLQLIERAAAGKKTTPARPDK
jgi:hypothetical protein